MWILSLLCDSHLEPSGAPGAVSSFSPLLWVGGQGAGRSWLLVRASSPWDSSGGDSLWVSRQVGQGPDTSVGWM